MKKILVLFSCLSLIFLSSCVQRDLIDIYVFSDRFSRYSENFQISDKELSAKEEENVLVFPFTFGDKFLLSVRVSKDTSLITSFSVVCIKDNKKTFTNNDFSDFKEIAFSAVRAFTKLENTENISKELSLDKKDCLNKNNHLSFKQGFFEYTFISNDLGLYFTASTERR